MRKYFLPLTVVLGIVLYYSCTKDKTQLAAPPDCTGIDPQANTYTNHISTILNSSCALPACHDAATAQAGADFSSYAAAVNAFKYKNVICAVKQIGCEPMPQAARPLADSLITFMECWQYNNYPE